MLEGRLSSGGSSGHRPCSKLIELEKKSSRYLTLPRTEIESGEKLNCLFGLRFQCPSPSSSEPLWYASAPAHRPSRSSILSKDLGGHRRSLVAAVGGAFSSASERLQQMKPIDDFSFSAAKMRVETRLKQRLQVCPKIRLIVPTAESFTYPAQTKIKSLVRSKNKVKSDQECKLQSTSSTLPAIRQQIPSAINANPGESATVKCKPRSRHKHTAQDYDCREINHSTQANADAVSVGRYNDPMSGASLDFNRRIAEMAQLETETKRWERAIKAKKKLLNTSALDPTLPVSSAPTAPAEPHSNNRSNTMTTIK